MDMQIQKPVYNSTDLTCFEIVWEMVYLKDLGKLNFLVSTRVGILVK